jgi:hypothetical protein
MNILAVVLLVLAVVVLVVALNTRSVKRMGYYLIMVGFLFGFLILAHILVLPGMSI